MPADNDATRRWQPRLWPSIVVIILLPLLFSLGCWQIHRAQQKKAILANLAKQQHQEPLNKLPVGFDNNRYQFQKITLSGRFLNEKSFLLDNRFYQHQLGFNVITAFLPNNSEQAILVNRGWVAATADRQQLPTINAISNPAAVSGLLYHPEKAFTLSKHEETSKDWPKIIQSIDFHAISAILNHELSPYLLIIDQNLSYALPQNWQPTTMTPGRHIAYAVQWYALTLVLFIGYIVLSIKRE